MKGYQLDVQQSRKYQVETEQPLTLGLLLSRIIHQQLNSITPSSSERRTYSDSQISQYSQILGPYGIHFPQVEDLAVDVTDIYEYARIMALCRGVDDEGTHIWFAEMRVSRSGLEQHYRMKFSAPH